MNKHRFFIAPLIIAALLALNACGTLQVGVEPTAEPTRLSLSIQQWDEGQSALEKTTISPHLLQCVAGRSLHQHSRMLMLNYRV